MSPECTIANRTILEEAAHIRRRLLCDQEGISSAVDTMQSQLASEARSSLGYSEPETTDLTDLIDTRISEETPVMTPATVTAALPLSERSAATTRDTRRYIGDILLSRDDRLIVITGPCSIHDPEAALEYADWVAEQRKTYGGELEIVMRAYMEKPRTELGWKGFVYDPKLDESNDINLGLLAARMVACQITNKGVPIAMERLNATTPQYFNGLVAYDAIGARNTTDQKAREYASGSSSPVGFKNTPEGSIKAAVEAVRAASAPHTFLGVNPNGVLTRVTTTGNNLAHVILRGSEKGPNYTSEHIEEARAKLASKRLPEAVIIDASHGNSGKNPDKHAEVIADIATQLKMGEVAIKGVMIESNLIKGNQPLEAGNRLQYGQSITDSCSGLEETEAMFRELADAVRTRRQHATV